MSAVSTGWAAAPENDDFVNRITLFGSQVQKSGTNAEAGTEFAETVHGVGAASPYGLLPGSVNTYGDAADSDPLSAFADSGQTVWYSWIAPFSGKATFSVSSASTARFSGTVYTGIHLASLNSVGVMSSNQGHGLNLEVVAGRAYQIAITGVIPPLRNYVIALVGDVDEYLGASANGDLSSEPPTEGAFVLSVSIFNEAPAVVITNPAYNARVPVNRPQLVRVRIRDLDSNDPYAINGPTSDLLVLQATTSASPAASPLDPSWTTIGYLSDLNPDTAEFIMAWQPTVAGNYYIRAVAYDLEDDTDFPGIPLDVGVPVPPFLPPGVATDPDRLPVGYQTSEATRMVVGVLAGPTAAITSPATGVTLSGSTTIVPVTVSVTGTNASRVSRLELYNGLTDDATRSRIATLNVDGSSSTYTLNWVPLGNGITPDGDYNLRVAAFISDGSGRDTGVYWISNTDVAVQVGDGGNGTIPQNFHPANDDFRNRQVLAGSQVQVRGTTQGASRESSEVAHGAQPNDGVFGQGEPAINPYNIDDVLKSDDVSDNTVWYSWVAPYAGRAHISITSTGLAEFGATVYRGFHIESTEQVTNFSTALRPTFNVQTGVTYMIGINSLRVPFGLSGRSSGPFVLSISMFNDAPEVRIVNPLNRSTQLRQKTDVEVKVVDKDTGTEITDPTVDMVELYANGVKIAELDSRPFVFSWLPPAVGNYQLQAVAIDYEDNRNDEDYVEIPGDFPAARQASSPITVTIINSPGGTGGDNTDTDFVNQLYKDFYQRSRKASEPLATYVSKLTAHTTTRQAVAQQFFNASQGDAFENLLTNFRALKGKYPVFSDYVRWTARVNAGRTPTQILQEIINADSSIRNLSNADFTTKLFKNILKRNPLPAESTFWVKQLKNKTITRPAMVLQLISKAKFATAVKTETRLSYLYLSLLQRAPKSTERSSGLSALSASSKEQLLIKSILSSNEYKIRILNL